ncbi:RidA family protein [Streptomyces sp. bgisy100]|uniref:RidA family protein n=1 Tax=Streptomyces sp. bgisy100 TaxID=3413783 RepID=UPI003D707D2A
MKTFRNPPSVHPPIAGYTHQIEVTGTPRWLAVSGQIGRSASGEVPVDGAAQLELALANLRAQLEAASMSVADVVKLTLYLVGDLDAPSRRAVLTEWAGGHRPCMTVVFVSALAAPEYLVEVEAWACAAASDNP